MIIIYAHYTYYIVRYIYRDRKLCFGYNLLIRFLKGMLDIYSQKTR